MIRALLVSMLISSAAHALVIDAPLADATQEAQARALFHELRCQVCQGQSVADSDAIVARQLRSFVRTNIADGKSADDIRHAVVEQYGASVLFESRHARGQWPLWLFPVLCVVLGLVIIVRRRKT